MSTELLASIAMYAILIALAVPFGKYIARVYAEKTWLDPVFGPMERLFFKLSGIDPTLEMNWKHHLAALLGINLLWFFLAMFVLMNQGWLPLEPLTATRPCRHTWPSTQRCRSS